ncbi:MAG: YfbM family protein [Actinomycetaceae bacterium]|nr:YfbM family protein [Actinomycetaceae bacterium]
MGVRALYSVESSEEHLHPDASFPSGEIGKLWDALHCLFTGTSAITPIEDSPLSHAIVGVEALTPIEVFAEEGVYYGVTPANEVAPIVRALESVDIGSLVAAADFSRFTEADIYPPIWDEDPEELREDLREAFHRLLNFYRAAAANNYAVNVHIS